MTTSAPENATLKSQFENSLWHVNDWLGFRGSLHNFIELWSQFRLVGLAAGMNLPIETLCVSETIKKLRI